MRDLPFHSPPRLLLFNIIPLRALAQLGHGSIRPNKESVISSGETIREPEGYIYANFMWSNILHIILLYCGEVTIGNVSLRLAG